MGGSLLGPEVGDRRSVRCASVARPTLVLGRSQPWSEEQAGAVRSAGWDVVRRASGGGAVLLVPGAQCWVDLTIPIGDPLWDDDVGRASWWVGAAWQSALAAIGVADAVVHRGPLEHRQLGSIVCFAGLGPGELTVAGRKVVGVSQRRTRAGARFECAALLEWDPAPLADVLGVGTDLSNAAMGLHAVRPGLDAATLEAALIEALPT